MGISHCGFAVFAINVIIDSTRLQWTRTKQRHQGNNVINAIRQQAPDKIFHPPRFQLENPSGLSGTQQLEGCRVINRNVFNFQC